MPHSYECCINTNKTLVLLRISYKLDNDQVINAESGLSCLRQTTTANVIQIIRNIKNHMKILHCLLRPNNIIS